MGLQVRTREVENGVHSVAISGILDENYGDLTNLTFPPGGSLYFDLKELTALNSIGIRELMKWLHALPNPVMSFANCPSVFILQLNMIAEFLPARARIYSFYVPYYSEKTNEETQILFVKDMNFQRGAGGVTITYPTVVDKTGSPMDIDANNRYFKFLDLYS